MVSDIRDLQRVATIICVLPCHQEGLRLLPGGEPAYALATLVSVCQAILSCVSACIRRGSSEEAPCEGPRVHLQSPHQVFHPLLQALCEVHASDEGTLRRCQKRDLVSIFGCLIR